MTIDGFISFCRRYAVLATLGMGVVWVCAFVNYSIYFFDNDCKLARCHYFADHLAFYTGARLTKYGPEEKLYDYGFVSDYQAKLFEPGSWTWLEAFRNPPFYAMLYWPTCGWTYFYSTITWYLISIGLVALGVRWLVGQRRYWRTLLWVFAFFPTYAAFDYGQNPPISFAILAGTFLLLKKERPFAAGLVAGLLFFKPNLLLGLGIWALLDIRRKWPCALGVLITGCALATLSWIVLPIATRDFLNTFERNRKFDNFEQFKMHNPLSFARLLLPAHSIAEWRSGPAPAESEKDNPNHEYYKTLRLVHLLHNGIAVAASLAAVVLFWRLWKHRRNDLHVMFGGAVFLTLFAGPHALIYEWLLLAITGILWVREWRDRPNTWFVLFACCWGVLFFSTDLSDIQQHFFSRQIGLPIAWQCSVPVLAVVGWYAVMLLTKPQSDEEDA